MEIVALLREYHSTPPSCGSAGQGHTADSVQRAPPCSLERTHLHSAQLDCVYNSHPSINVGQAAALHTTLKPAIKHKDLSR